MNKVLKATSVFAFMSVLSGCEHPEHASPVSQFNSNEQNSKPIKVATWNIEHLAFPSNNGCKPRSTDDIRKLKNYANSLDANIVALQEVASKDALREIFPETQWQLIISDRSDSPNYECRKTGNLSTQQKVAFAVHNSIPVLNVNHNNEFNLEMPGLRNGLAITVNTKMGNTEILNVHLKSGCFVEDYSQSDKKACNTFAKQAPIIDSWIEKRENASTPYIVLGDFNHRLASPENKLFDELNHNTNNKASTLHLSTQGITGCHPRYPAPIDHIIFGGKKGLTHKTAQVHKFKNMNEDEMLSDHCAISLKL